MNMILPHLSLAVSEIMLLSMTCVLLIIDVSLPERYRHLTYFMVQLTLIVTFFASLPQFKDYATPVIALGGHYVIDKLAVLTKLFLFVFSFFAFAYARDFLKARQIDQGAYYLLGLFAVLGMSIMASAFSFLSLFLGLELLSLALYAMVAIHKEDGIAAEAAMKYFVLGSLASGILLYGISLFYGITGSIEINQIASQLTAHPTLVTQVALIFVLGGLVFKFGAVPFHMWVPDVYQGAPTPTTLFIASAPKVAAFAVMVRILVKALPTLHVNWEHMLIVVSILSMGLGNVLAIVQTNLKRMLAYSSIAHIGYTLLGVLAGPNSVDGYSAAMFYIATYVLVAAGAFAIISMLSQPGFECEQLEDFRGLNTRHPWLAFLMLLLMFSMAGVPPAVGFFAKLGLLKALVEADMVWLAVVALIFALVGAYYYLRVVMLMYFEEPLEDRKWVPARFTFDTLVLVSINGAAALFLGLLPSFFIDLCRITVG